MRAVIPSVNYADFLAVTLPAWLAILPHDSVTVVTSDDDVETQAVAERHDVQCVITDAWTRDGATLNKAAALDEAFGLAGDLIAPPSDGELCLALDADGFPCGTWPLETAIAPNTIYGCGRYHCETPEALQAHRTGRTRRTDLALIPPKVRGSQYGAIPHTAANLKDTATKCLGYFQLWRHAPQYRFGVSKTAGGYDLRFRDQFPRRAYVSDVYILHLGPQDRSNWKGRVLPRWTA
jgi:hypothetical protein